MVDYTIEEAQQMTPAKAKDVLRAEDRQAIIHNVHPSLLHDGLVETSELDFKQGPALVKAWSKFLPKEEVDNMYIIDSLKLRPEVRDILSYKVKMHKKKGGRKTRGRKTRKTRKH